MSYRGSGYPGYGQGSMPMPAPYQKQQQPYPAGAASYPAQNTPYPSQPARYPTPPSQPAQYPTPPRMPLSYANQSTPNALISAALDNAMDELVKDLSDLLSNATSEELEEILNNEDRINQLVSDSKQSRDLERKRKEMSSENVAMAECNLTLQPEFEALKLQLSELGDRQLVLKETYSSHLQRVSSLISPDTISAILEAATSEKDLASDSVKTSFFNEEIAVDEFLKQFIEERTIYQSRKIKLEKMTELLRGTRRPLPPNSIGATPLRSNTVPPSMGYFGYSVR